MFPNLTLQFCCGLAGENTTSDCAMSDLGSHEQLEFEGTLDSLSCPGC